MLTNAKLHSIQLKQQLLLEDINEVLEEEDTNNRPSMFSSGPWTTVDLLIEQKQFLEIWVSRYSLKMGKEHD